MENLNGSNYVPVNKNTRTLKKIWFKEIELRGWDGQNISYETVHVSYVRYFYVMAKLQVKFAIYRLKSLVGKG